MDAFLAEGYIAKYVSDILISHGTKGSGQRSVQTIIPTGSLNQTLVFSPGSSITLNMILNAGLKYTTHIGDYQGPAGHKAPLT